MLASCSPSITTRLYRKGATFMMPAQNQDTPRKNLAVNADSREFSSVFRSSGAEDTVWAVYVYGDLMRWPGRLRTVSAEVFTDCLHTRITVGRRAPAALGCPLPQLDESPRALLGWKPTNKHQWTQDPSSANDLNFTQKCNFAVRGKTEDW